MTARHAPSTVPFLDLAAQYRTIAHELEPATLAVLRSGAYALGPAVEAFEQDFAEYCGTRHAVAVNSGTAALHLALLAAGVRPGDEVVTVATTFVATVAAILQAGAVPRLVDIDPDSWTMDPEQVEAALTPRTRAILPVHLHGRVADMAALRDIARRHGLLVIEDAAQAHGAEREGKQAGTFGDAAAFSFYPGKNLGACGEGGALVTDRDDIAAAARRLRDWGQDGRYNHVERGFNYRMDGIQGAVLRVKLRHLDGWISGRRRVALRYGRLLSKLDVGLPRPDGGHVWHVFAVRLRERDAVRQALHEAGVATGIHYPKPVHLQPAYADLGYGPGDLPVSEGLARETLSLPMFPEMTPSQIERVTSALRDAVAVAPGIPA